MYIFNSQCIALHCKHNLWTIWILELTKGADIGRKTENKEADVSSDGQITFSVHMNAKCFT